MRNTRQSPTHPLPAWQRTTLAAEQAAQAKGANARVVYLHARRGGRLQALAERAEARLARDTASAELLCRGAVAAADHDIEGAGWGDFSQLTSAPAPLAAAEACTELGYRSGTLPPALRHRHPPARTRTANPATRWLLRRLGQHLRACRPALTTTVGLLAVLAALGLAMHSDYHELVLPQVLMAAQEGQP